MTKPASFPFLAIANRHDLPYGTVLTTAELIKAKPYIRARPTHYQKLEAAWDEIRVAVAEFLAIQRGEINWQTGELQGQYSNGAPMFAHDGTMLDANGNRSIFDDVDE